MKITYILYSHKNKAVKIGYASSLASRVSAIQVSTPEELSLLFTFQGGKEIESELHELLFNCRLRGEWFAYNRDTLDILLNYQQKKLKEHTFSTKKLTKQVALKHVDETEIISVVLNKAECLYKEHRSKKITIPEIKTEIPYRLETRVIKNILLDAGWITVKQGSCKTLFFTQPEVS